MDKVGKVFAFDNAMFFESSQGVVTNLQRLSFNAREPSRKARESEWILFPGIDQCDGTWTLELSATAFGTTGRSGWATGAAVSHHSKGEVINVRRLRKANLRLAPQVYGCLPSAVTAYGSAAEELLREI